MCLKPACSEDMTSPIFGATRLRISLSMSFRLTDDRAFSTMGSFQESTISEKKLASHSFTLSHHHRRDGRFCCCRWLGSTQFSFLLECLKFRLDTVSIHCCFLVIITVQEFIGDLGIFGTLRTTYHCLRSILLCRSNEKKLVMFGNVGAKDFQSAFLKIHLGLVLGCTSLYVHLCQSVFWDRSVLPVVEVFQNRPGCWEEVIVATGNKIKFGVVVTVPHITE